ncbi:MAG: DUF2975 domain-containing protein [Sphingomonadales bacterium]|nr:MAG: DUF2975 domain-containing protein [Sphingomonadales bacterium]
MNFRSSDPLLTAAKVVVALLIALSVFVMAMITIALGALLSIERTGLMADLASAGAPQFAYWIVVLAIAMLIALFWHALQFLRDLWSIIASVDAGDPFRLANADLLNRMGWTVLSAYITALLIALQAAWLERFAPLDSMDAEVNIDLGAGGLLLMLTLFILARVFRHGAAMREDLEGTV